MCKPQSPLQIFYLKVSSNAEGNAMSSDNHNPNPLDYSGPCTDINDHT